MSDTDQSEPKKPEPDNGAPSAFGNQPPETGQPGGMVLFNGKSAVHAGSNGTLTTTDPCWTKIGKSSRVVPYINVAKSADADNTAATVFINGHPACHLRSTFSKSTGDEAGYAGVKSGTIQGKAEFLTSSPNVYIEGIPAVRQHDLMVSNNRNTPPAPLMQPGNTQDLEDAILRAEEVLDGPPPDAVVVEVAGVNKQLVFGYIGIGDRRDNPTKERLVPAGGDDDEHGHYQRVSIGSAPGEYETYLVLWDSIGDAYRIPIDKISTVKRENPPENTHVLVPVTPLVYTTADRDPQQADMCRKGGWIYVFRNGKLWRECRVINHFSLKDVNLDQHRGKTHRPAECGADAHLLLVHKANGTVQKNEVAFSEVQWSWERIAAMEKSAKLRSERLVKVDLSGYGGGFPLIEAAPGTARVENGANAPDVFALIHDRKSDMPVVYLDDPIGIARRLAADYQLAWKDMADCLYKLKSAPERCKADGNYDPQRWYEAAALANRYFYSPLPKNASPELAARFGQYQSRLDKAAIDEALGVEDRRQIREKIKDTKKSLVDYLNAQLFSPDPADGMPITTTLDDYFTLPRENSDIGYPSPPNCYGEGFRVVADIIADLAKHEYSLDHVLEADPPNGWEKRRRDPGFKLLRRIADPMELCELHDRIFPTAAGGANPLAAGGDPSNKADPRFKSGRFDPRPWEKTIEGVAHLARHFDEIAAMRDKPMKASLDRGRDALLRLVSVALHLDLSYDNVTLGQIIGWKNAASDSDPTDTRASTQPSTDTDVFAIMRRSVKFIDKAYKVLPKGETASNASEITTRIATSPNSMFVTLLAKRMGEEQAIKCGLVGLVGIVETINFFFAVESFMNHKKENRDWVVYAKVASGFFNLSKAATDFSKLAFSNNRQIVTPKNLPKAISRNWTLNAAKIGAGASVFSNIINLGVTYHSFEENLAQADDASIPDGIILLGVVLGLISDVGFLVGLESIPLLAGLSLPIPVIGVASSIILLATAILKETVFKEDTPIEIWLNNGPFRVAMDGFSKQSGITGDCGKVRYRDLSGTGELIVHPDGTIAGIHKSRFDNGVLKKRNDGTIYVQRGDKEIDIGKEGEPFDKKRLNDPNKRFGGHQAGQDPISHIPKDEKNPDRCYKYRFALWCEDPNIAYLALADAIYRPTVKFHTVSASYQYGTCTLEIEAPFFIDGQSQLYVDWKAINEKDKVCEKQAEQLSKLKKNKFGISYFDRVWQISPGESRKYHARTRLDLFGDGKVWLPSEPAFSKHDIETITDDRKVENGGDPIFEKWIVDKGSVSVESQENMAPILRIFNADKFGVKK